VGTTAGAAGMREIEFAAGVTNPLTAVNRRAKRAMNVGLIMVAISVNVFDCAELKRLTGVMM